MIEILPPEVLSRIFVLSKVSKRTQHIKPFELTLSHVSQWWRNVAVTTPELWCAIDVYTPRRLKLADRYVERSGAVPLSLHVDVYTWESRRRVRNTKLVNFTQALGMLLHSQRGRWCSISIFTYEVVTQQAIIDVLRPESAPLLESLQLRTERGHPAADLETTRLLSSGAPNLTQVYTNLLGFWPPMSRLVTLCIHRAPEFALPDFSDLLHLLSEATVLVNLSLHNCLRSAQFSSAPPPSLHLNRLELLSISGGGDGISDFLIQLSAPNLQSLWLQTSPSTDLARFFQFTSPQQSQSSKFHSLRYLTLTGVNLMHLIGYSFAFPTITTLHIAYCPIARMEFTRRAIIDKWASLQTLVLRARVDTANSHTQFEFWPEFVKKRDDARLPIARFLADEDCWEMMKDHPDIRNVGTTELGILSADNYEEPGWLLRENRQYQWV